MYRIVYLKYDRWVRIISYPLQNIFAFLAVLLLGRSRKGNFSSCPILSFWFFSLPVFDIFCFLCRNCGASSNYVHSSTWTENICWNQSYGCGCCGSSAALNQNLFQSIYRPNGSSNESIWHREAAVLILSCKTNLFLWWCPSRPGGWRMFVLGI